MGEEQPTLFPLEFNRSIVVEARSERLSGDSGALMLREAYSRLGLDDFFGERLVDRRDACLHRPKVDSDSNRKWTPVPMESGQ